MNGLLSPRWTVAARQGHVTILSPWLSLAYLCYNEQSSPRKQRHDSNGHARNTTGEANCKEYEGG